MKRPTLELHKEGTLKTRALLIVVGISLKHGLVLGVPCQTLV